MIQKLKKKTIKRNLINNLKYAWIQAAIAK